MAYTNQQTYVQGDQKLPNPLPSGIGTALAKTNDYPSKYNSFKKSLPILVLGKNIFGEKFRFRFKLTSLFSSFGHYLVFSQIFV